MTLPRWRRLPAYLLLVTIAAVLYLGTRTLGRRALEHRASWQASEEPMLLPRPQVAGLLFPGTTELAADMVWARTLVYVGDGYARQAPMLDLNGLLALVNALDPHFRRPYIWGSYALGFREDPPTAANLLAAARILERGLEVFPDDWELAWRAGTRYAYDVKGASEAETARYRERGIGLIERAMRMSDAPSDLPVEAAALRTELGQKDRALRELREMILTTTNDKARNELLRRYQSMVNLFVRDELESAAKEFAADWKANAPFVTPTFYVLLGKRPAAYLDLEPPPAP